MNQLFCDTIDTLRTAQSVLRNEIEWRDTAGSINGRNLRRLREAARSFQARAHSLLVTMLFHADVPDALRHEVEHLVEVFSDMVDQIEAMLASDPQPN